jgi:hypothetical protein
VFRGFTITNAEQGLTFIGGNDNKVIGVQFTNLGQEALSFRGYSKRNVVDSIVCHDTGKLRPQYGECVYVGSYSGHWCLWTNCQPDRSDSNSVLRSHLGPNTGGAEAVDVKEGTTGTVVRDNTLDGTGQILSPPAVALLAVFGNQTTVSRNRFTNGAQNAVYIERSPLASGASTTGSPWGRNNKAAANTIDLGGAPGYGFKVGFGPKPTTVIRCDNQVKNAGSGFSNMACTP